MYKEILEKHKVKQTTEFTLSIITSEVGKLHQFLYRRQRFGKEGYLGDEEITTGDLMLVVGLFAEQKGYDLSKIHREALARFEERIIEVKKAEIESKFGDNRR